MPKYPGISPYDNEKGTLGTAKKRWEKIYVKEIESDTIDGVNATVDYLATTAENSVANAVAAKNAAVDAKVAAENAAETAATAAAGIQSVVETDVDNTLSIAGVAADAKVTGDWLNAIAKPVTGDTSLPGPCDEFLQYIEDADHRLLFGIKRDGSVTWQKGIPQHVKDAMTPTMQNDEYLYAIVDPEEHVLFAIKKDGTVDWQKGTPKHVVEACNPTMENEEYIYLIKDAEDKVLFGIKQDGSVYWPKGLPKWVEERINQDTIKNEEYVQITQDADGKIIEGVLSDGTKKFSSKVRFENEVDLSKKSCASLIETLKSKGYLLATGDWSDAKELSIPMPRCAVINFTGISNMPQAKFVDMQGIMSFWDMQGNYFQKNVIMNGQGQATMNCPKKNCAIDICNDNWIGDDTFKLQIGDWVAQDGFHLKANWNDYSKGGIAQGGYKFANDIWKSRGFDKDRPWKKALIDMDDIDVSVKSGEDTSLQIDTGARNMPDGFPCVVYLNRDFVGIFAFQLKKHHDNFHMDKKEAKQIHLDSRVSAGTILDVENIDWTAFEVRNPKSIYCMDGTKYDGDTNCNELMDNTSTYYDGNNKDHVRSNKVKQYINNLNTNFGAIRTAQSNYEASRTAENRGAVKVAYEKVFDIENMIDYLIFCDITWNWDGVSNNCQWCTYDGKKWYLCPYDLDHCYERDPNAGHINTSRAYPFYYIYTYYKDELESRYAELRRLGILTVEHIINIINDWALSIGYDFFEKEKEKWPTEPQDSLFRVKKWLDTRIAVLDNLYNYR